MAVADLIAFAGSHGMGLRITTWPAGGQWVARVQCQFLDGKGATPKWQARAESATAAIDRAAGQALAFWEKGLNPGI